MGEVVPLIPEPQRYVIHPLPNRGGQQPWKRSVHAILEAQAVRFDGREDMLGNRCMRFLSDCSVSLGVVNVPAEYALIVTRVRMTAVNQVLRSREESRARNHSVNVTATVNNLRRLHHIVLATIEATVAEEGR